MVRLRKTPQILPSRNNDDIAGKFAEMRLTPSVSKIRGRPNREYRRYTGDPKTAHINLLGRKPRTSPAYSGPEVRYLRDNGSRSVRGVLLLHDNGIPLPLYNILKKVVDALEDLKKNPDDQAAKSRLRIEERGVEVASSYFKGGKLLATDWKYERDNINQLLN